MSLQLMGARHLSDDQPSQPGQPNQSAERWPARYSENSDAMTPLTGCTGIPDGPLDAFKQLADNGANIMS